MVSISNADVIEYNESINESDWWCKDELLDSCFSSYYYYYGNELEQISSIFRGLAKNHAFSNGNKRTAAAVLTIFLLQNGYEMDENDLISLTEEVINNNFEVTEIAEKIFKLIRPIN